MQEIRKKYFCPMAPEQEAGYKLTCAERILRYHRIMLWIIIGIQLYNMVYVFFYTNGRLESIASRVYMGLYLFLFLLSLGGIFLRRFLSKNLPQKAVLTIRMQILYCFILLVWSVCVTVYDQRVSDNISVYMITALTVSMLVYMTPVQTVLIYGCAQVLLFFVMFVFYSGTKDTYGTNVNTSVISLMAVFVCSYRYVLDRRRYLEQEDMEEKNRMLNHLANRDSLTGLRNRRFLNKDMESLYRSCAQEQSAMTFMMMDIDCFKDYNDTYGHQQGDECLRRLSWRLEQELDEKNEFLIRYGGEEFLYIGAGVDRAEAELKAKRFNEVIRRLIIGPSEQDRRSVTISIGVCTAHPSLGQAEEKAWISCIAEADQALYHAKKSGKDRWCAF